MLAQDRKKLVKKKCWSLHVIQDNTRLYAYFLLSKFLKVIILQFPQKLDRAKPQATEPSEY